MPEVPVVVGEELGLFADVRERLLALPPPEEAGEEELVAELKRIQAEIHAAKTEDKPALEQQYDHLSRLLEQLRRGRPTERVDPGSPYFAHLRLMTEGRAIDVMLGRATCLAEGLRIVDWRHAPISRVYYRYQEGEEYEEDIGPRVVSGTLQARRTVSIVAGELRRVSGAQGTWTRAGEGWNESPAVQARLAGAAPARAATAADQRLGSGHELRADKHLPDIAALIDPEQFELISRPDSGPVVIRGGAGSGKTTVALHRVAWLAYQDPRRFAPHKILVVAWGRALRDYVSLVLPGLGVHGVSVVTWPEWSQQLVARHYPGLPAHPAPSTPSAVSRVKLHPGLPRVLEALVRSRHAPPTATSAVEDWKLLVGDRARLGALDGVTLSDLDVLTAWARKQQRELELREHGEKDAEPWLDDEDHAILLRAYQLRAGPLKAKGGGTLRYAHVAVDEVQDFSPMEIAILLGACDTSRCITLAGDTQQHISVHGGSLRWDGLLGALGVEARELNTLRVSYRSTFSITAFARAVLGDLAEDDAPPLGMREGPPVDCFTFPEHGACVEFLGTALRELAAAEPLASVALIARDVSTARLYFEGLDGMDVPRLRLVEEQVFAFQPGVDVVDVAQIKGLEFDYVVILDASRGSWPDRGHDRRLLHVAATRAVHQLWVTAVGEIAPFVPSR